MFQVQIELLETSYNPENSLSDPEPELLKRIEERVWNYRNTDIHTITQNTCYYSHLSGLSCLNIC